MRGFKMKKTGLDSVESWGIAGASIIINFLILAPARLSGVLFVAFMDRYKVNRKQASLPFSVCYVLRTLPGPLAGFLGESFGLRAVSIIGCILATVGVGACFFAEDILTVTLLFGGFYGLGYGFVCSLIPEFLNQYFDKHLAKANGLTMGGAGLGAFLLPPIVEILMYVYGVSGMMLIFGGLVLHSVPATMLLRKANFENKLASSEVVNHCIEGKNPDDKPPLFNFEEQTHRPNVFGISSEIETRKSDETESVTKSSSKRLEFERSTYVNPIAGFEEDPEYIPHPIGPSGNIQKSTIVNNGHKSSVQTKSDKIKHLPTVEKLSQIEIGNLQFPAESCDIKYGSNKQMTLLNKSNFPLLLDMRNLRNSIDVKDFHFTFKKERYKDVHKKLIHSKDKQRNSACQSFRVFTDPAFLFIALTQSTYFFLMFLIWTIIVDFARDKGIPPEEEVYFVMCLSLSDTLGRLGLGCITDSDFLTKSNYSALCFLGMAAFCIILPSSTSFAAMLISVFIYGFISGGVMIIFPGMVAQFVHKDLRTMAMASRTCLNAPMSMMISPLIGFFRGHSGSYDWILYIMAMFSLVCSFTSWFTPTMAKIRDNRLRKR